MIDARFSAEAFQELGCDTVAARGRADILAEEVYQQLHRVIEQEMQEIVRKLNSMGHQLKLRASSPGDNTFPGDVDYGDDWTDEQGHHYRLRLAVTTVVSTGYAHLEVPADEK